MRNTLYYLEYGKKHSKTWKMRNPHRRTWNMARKLKNVENLEMSTVGRGIWQEN